MNSRDAIRAYVLQPYRIQNRVWALESATKECLQISNGVEVPTTFYKLHLTVRTTFLGLQCIPNRPL